MPWLTVSRSVAINIARMLCHKPDPADFRAQVLAMTLSVGALAPQPVWPSDAARQRELDDIPCCICLDAAGHDNMVICDGHLNCIGCIIGWFHCFHFVHNVWIKMMFVFQGANW